MPLNAWFLVNVTVEIPPLSGRIESTIRPPPSFVIKESADSLVILPFRSLVWTSPIGEESALDLVGPGLSSILSLSVCGYRSVTFWPYCNSVNSEAILLSALSAYMW